LDLTAQDKVYQKINTAAGSESLPDDENGNNQGGGGDDLVG